MLDRRGPRHQAGEVDQGGGEEAEVEQRGGGRQDGAGRRREQLEGRVGAGQQVSAQPGLD